ADIVPFLEDQSIPLTESLQVDNREDLPVWGISLEQAQRYANWMSDRDPEYNYRLPTEVEWEIAARGPDFREDPYGNAFDPKAANTVESGIGQTSPVHAHAHAPGPFGHLDLAGNVEEWVCTKYFVYPGGKVVVDNLYETFG